jgi:hypothetical protein
MLIMRVEGIRIRMTKTVRGGEGFPLPVCTGPPGTILRECEEYEAKANQNGAVSGKCANGEWLGVKPGEFEFAAAPIWLLKIHRKNLDDRMLIWLRTGERGSSSETIFEVLAEHPIMREPFAGSTPRDPSDFRRCYLLLEAIPEWRNELQKVAEVYPEWKPFADNWPELERLYLEEAPTKKAPKLYSRIHQLNGEEG